MHQVAVDVQDGRAVVFGVDDMFVPDFVVKGSWHLNLGLAHDFRPSEPHLIAVKLLPSRRDSRLKAG